MASTTCLCSGRRMLSNALSSAWTGLIETVLPRSLIPLLSRADSAAAVTGRPCCAPTHAASTMAKRLTSEDVLDRLTQLFTQRGAPHYLPLDKASEFTAKKVRKWLSQRNVKTLYVEPGRPWANRYIEASNGKLRDELLDREIFYTLK